MYAYNAALYCDKCGQEIIDDCNAKGIEDEGDTDGFPQWASDDSESDCPQHCDNCREFLENPLTSDGYEYVRDAIAAGTGDPNILAQWASYYDIETEDESEDDGE